MRVSVMTAMKELLMRRAILGVMLALASSVYAQPQRPSLSVTVVDPTGALIVGADVQVTPEGAATVRALTGQSGAARIELPAPGRVTLRVDAPGFEPAVDTITVRRDTSRTVKLALGKVHETVDVGRDPRERASDPRSDIFATILGAAEIQELPDDPDDMERVLREMAGPGAVMRVNGFRGGRLPPKEQISQIRFRRNMFAADTHEPGFIGVDIITKPGFDAWNGATSAALREQAMNARNALAPVRGDERYTRGAFTASGPLWKKHTSMAISLDGTNAFDTQTLIGATLAGPFARSIQRPNDTANGSIRIEHALTPSRQLRMELQQGRVAQKNLGVGNFNLESRAYSQTRDDRVVRGSLAGNIGTKTYNELRTSWRSQVTESASNVSAPTIAVLNAFTDGGAQIDGQRESTLVEIADDLDIARGRHAIRTGVLLEHGRYQTSEERNGIGTVTFSDLAAYAAGRATTFTRTVGNPDARLARTQVAVYAQDDIRINPQLTLSGGVRHEWQSGIGGLHLGPRAGIAWSPFRSGRTTVRGGAGIFFDWFEADGALRAVQLDGTHQQVETWLNPSYPWTADSNEGAVLSNGRVVLSPFLEQPLLREASGGIEQTLGALRLNAMVIHRRGDHELRGIDINAPVDGRRADPMAGPVTEIQSTARSGFDALSVNLNLVKPERRSSSRPITPSRVRGTRPTRRSPCLRILRTLMPNAAPPPLTHDTARWGSPVFPLATASSRAWRSTPARRCRTTSSPAATITATVSATIGRLVSLATADADAPLRT
ncbi:MAG: TonB-dependent receptor [Vicinamibacterales bacterium]